MTSSDPLTAAEPTDDQLWEAVAASMAVADEHKRAIYRTAEGVAAPDALAGIEKHISAGLAARVMYDRLTAERAARGRVEAALDAALTDKRAEPLQRGATAR